MRVLVTGFGPFPGVDVNPSELAVRELVRLAGERGDEPWPLLGVELSTAILPVDFAVLSDRVAELVATAPEVMVLLGVDARATGLSVERIGINVIDARVSDATGAQPVDQPVVPGGPDGRFATIPVKAVRAALEEAGLPAVISHSAGTYACNAAMYAALDAAPQKTRVGFIHIPPADVIDPDVIARGIAAALAVALTTTQDLATPAGTLA